ncbi:hypothetical protein KC19_4G089700 [Ceratodon purpureus]|uniref:Uncharacterized protein n=1 Tax=Ceratodon purpureus TaxID=3225 RepID=A0A8T0I747_CERPU|nr:hypothetical protein KC19_4G089700 [Ceratodon purpureus]
MENLGMVQEAKIIVGLDFGTTFSGFAYALRSDPDTIYTFYDWPMQAASGGIPYCKTQTSLLYADARETSPGLFELRDWGWPAFVKYKSTSAYVANSVRAASGSEFKVIHDLDVLSLSGIPRRSISALKRDGHSSPGSGIGYFLTLFKLHLASKLDASTSSGETTSGPTLPPGMTPKRAIADYLSQISKFILRELRNKFGSHISQEDIQWCLTVPAIWDEQAKREMKHCAEIAGLVQGPYGKEGGSPHAVKLFIEPEAASVYCQMKLKDHTWNKGDKFLVVDCGGGTVDLVLHEKLGPAPSISVREVQESSGGLCGGSRVDEEFFGFLRRRISCFKRFEALHPAIVLDFRQEWEKVKYKFDGDENGEVHLDLPPKLASMWEQEHALSLSRRPSMSNFVSFDEMVLTENDMKSIFDPVVTMILELVEARMVSELQAIMVVGGFSASPYLMSQIKNAFGGRVAAIVSPPNPGSAVCCGAVTMGIRSETVVLRISKRTYGKAVSKRFIVGEHPDELKEEGDPGEFFCKGIFDKFVSKGEAISINDCVKNSYKPIRKNQKKITFKFFSTACSDPKYVTDLGVETEGSFKIDCPSYNELGVWPSVEVSMFFGRTEIQVSAVAKNFDSEKKQIPVKFDRDSIY